MVWQKGQSGNPGIITAKKGRKALAKRRWKMPNAPRPNCIDCGKPARPHTTGENGIVKYWRNHCNRCHKLRGQSQYNYRLTKKSYCEKCGFVAKHRVQLDVDHIDGNHKNNSVENLQTICANCHRLKTVTEGNHDGRRYIPIIK